MKRTRGQALRREGSREVLLVDVAVDLEGDEAEVMIRAEQILMLLQTRAMRVLQQLPKKKTRPTKQK